MPQEEVVILVQRSLVRWVPKYFRLVHTDEPFQRTGAATRYFLSHLPQGALLLRAWQKATRPVSSTWSLDFLPHRTRTSGSKNHLGEKTRQPTCAKNVYAWYAPKGLVYNVCLTSHEPRPILRRYVTNVRPDNIKRATSNMCMRSHVISCKPYRRISARVKAVKAD